MGAGRFVGRVGGLAIAMGVGTAVSFGHGVAWADDTGDAGKTASSESRPSSDRPKPAPSKPDSVSKDASAADDTSSDETESESDSDDESASEAPDDAEDDDDVTAEKATDDDDVKRSGSSRKRQSEKADTSEAKPDRVTREARVGKTADKDAADAPAPVSTPSVSASTTSAPLKMAPVTESVVSVPPPAAEATAARVTSVTVSNSVLGGGQGAPADSPVAWIVAAAARRELGVTPVEKTAAVPTVTAAAANKVPVIGTVKVNAPNATTGVVTGTVAATDPDKDKLTFAAPAKTTKGALVVNATTGAFTYTPTAAARHAAASTTATAAVKSDSFTVTVTDGKGGTATKLVSVVVAPKNAAPTGGKATVTTPNSTTGVVTGTVTATDADKDKLTYTASTKPAKGAVVLNATTGAFTFTPTAAARLAAGKSTATAADKKDTITVTASDGFGGTTQVVVTVVIAPNKAPSGGKATVGTPNATTGVVTGTVVATDADKDKLTYVASKPAKGTVVLNATTGAFTYTPTATARHTAAATGAAASTKADTFTVTASDGKGGTVPITVTVVVSPKNTAPTGVKATVGSTNTTTGVVTGTLTATDADKDPVTFTAPTKTAKGAVVVTGSTFTYTPTAAARLAAGKSTATAADKQDTITVTASDGFGGITQLAVVVTIAPNRAPSGGKATVGTPNTTTGVVTGSVVATDADKDPVTYTATKPTKGTVVLNATTGAFTYTPTAAARHAAASTTATAAAKADTFTVTASDGKGGTVPIAVTVVVSPKNTAPTGVKATVGSTNTTTGVVTGTLTATDADGDVVKFSGPTTTPKGTLVVSGSTFTYTPTAAARTKAASSTATATDKQDTFTVTATDGFGGSAPITVTVTVAPDTSKTSGLNVSAGSGISLPGRETGSVLSQDGTRAVVTTVSGDENTGYTTNVGVVNMATSKQVGKTITLAGEAQRVELLDNGRALITTESTNVSGAVTTNAVLVDASTGAKVGSTLALAGGSNDGYMLVDDDDTDQTDHYDDYYGGVQVTGDGTRVVMVTFQENSNGTSTTRIAVMNASTGAKVGNTLAYTGSQSFVTSAADGARLVIATQTVDAADQSSIRVSSVNAVTGTLTGSPVVVAGGTDFSSDRLPLQVSADGSRAVISTNTYDYSAEVSSWTGRTAVVNLTTGSQIGATSVQTLENGYGLTLAEVNTDGTRIVLTTALINPSTGAATSSVTMLNGTTGAVTGTPVMLSGATSGETIFTDDGTRVVIMTDVPDFDLGGTKSSSVSVINTATGAQVGTTVTIPAASQSEWNGKAGVVQLNPGGSRAVVTTVSGDYEVGYTTRIVLINTATGTKVGTTTVLAGSAAEEFGIVFTDDGTRAFIDTVSTDDSGASTTRLAIINTATGAQLGKTVTLAGDSNGWWETSSDGTRVLVEADSYNWETDTTKTNVALFNTVTGVQVGITRTYTGSGAWAHYVDDTSRVVVLATEGTEQAGYTTKITVLDGGTGAQVGTTRTLAGNVSYDYELDRAATIVSSDGGWQVPGSTTRLLSLNTSNSTQTGGIITIDGYLNSLEFASDSRSGFVTTVTGNDVTGYQTKLTVLTLGAPINTKATVANPNASTGVVTGSLVATDPAGAVTYSGPTSTGKGTVVINKTTGVFTYTPTASTRHDVLAPGAITTDTFTVLVKDAAGNFAEVPVTVKIAPGANVAPTNVKATVTAPNSFTSVVTGTVTGADADGDALIFSGPATTSKGTLTVNSSTGTFSYTPTAAAKQKAGAPGAPAADKQDTFVITVTDGHGAAAIPVTVKVTIIPGKATPPATAVAVSKTINVGGQATEGFLSADGKRAIVKTVDQNTVKYSVVDVNTGSVIGNPVAVAANGGTGSLPSTVQFTPSGDRAVVSTPGSVLLIINTATGSQVGSTNVIASSTVPPVLNAAGDRVMVNGIAYDSDTGVAGSRVSIVDTTKGQLVYASDSDSFIGAVGVFSADGTRAVITAMNSGPSSGEVTELSDISATVKVVNAATGAQVGDTYTGTGYTAASLNRDGSRVVISTVTGNSTTLKYTSSLSVVNTITGVKIGVPLVLAGAAIAPAAVTADGARAVLTVAELASSENPFAGNTRLVFLDLGTGKQVGKTISVDGIAFGAAGYAGPQFSVDGTRALLTTLVNSAVIDMATGAVTTTVPGDLYVANMPKLSPDGSRILMVTGDYFGSETMTITAKLLDATTGVPIGTPLTLAGGLMGEPQFSSDGSRVVITSMGQDGSTGQAVTRVVVLNTSSGQQAGATLTLPGVGYSVKISADGTRAFAVTADTASGTPVSKARIIKIT